MPAPPLPCFALPGLPLGHATFNIDSIESRPSYGYDPLTDRWVPDLECGELAVAALEVLETSPVMM